MSLKFIIDEMEDARADKIARRRALRRKRDEIFSALLLGFMKIITPIFWVAVIIASVMTCKSLLYYSAITEKWQMEYFLKGIVIMLAMFNIAIIYTWIKESEIWRRTKLLFKKRSLTAVNDKPSKNWRICF